MSQWKTNYLSIEEQAKLDKESEMVTEELFTDGDYPEFPTDTPSTSYNSVSKYYAGQIERLKWMIREDAPLDVVNAQRRFCHGIAIGLSDGNWLSCVMNVPTLF